MSWLTRPRINVICPECGQERMVVQSQGIRVHQNRMCHRCAGQLSTGVRMTGGHARARQAQVDTIAVERLIAGQPPTHVTRAERQAAVHYLTQHGHSISAISRRTRMSTRTVERLRNRREP